MATKIMDDPMMEINEFCDNNIKLMHCMKESNMSRDTIDKIIAFLEDAKHMFTKMYLEFNGINAAKEMIIEGVKKTINMSEIKPIINNEIKPIITTTTVWADDVEHEQKSEDYIAMINMIELIYESDKIILKDLADYARELIQVRLKEKSEEPKTEEIMPKKIMPKEIKPKEIMPETPNNNDQWTTVVHKPVKKDKHIDKFEEVNNEPEFTNDDFKKSITIIGEWKLIEKEEYETGFKEKKKINAPGTIMGVVNNAHKKLFRHKIYRPVKEAVDSEHGVVKMNVTMPCDYVRNHIYYKNDTTGQVCFVAINNIFSKYYTDKQTNEKVPNKHFFDFHEEIMNNCNKLGVFVEFDRFNYCINLKEYK